MRRRLPKGFCFLSPSRVKIPGLPWGGEGVEYSPSKYSFCLWPTPWIWKDIKNSGEAFVRKTSWRNRSIQVFWTRFQAVWIPGYSSVTWRVGRTSCHCSKWRLLTHEVYQLSLCIVSAHDDLPGASLHFQVAYYLFISSAFCVVNVYLTFIDSKLFCR